MRVECTFRNNSNSFLSNFFQFGSIRFGETIYDNRAIRQMRMNQCKVERSKTRGIQIIFSHVNTV